MPMYKVSVSKFDETLEHHKVPDMQSALNLVSVLMRQHDLEAIAIYGLYSHESPQMANFTKMMTVIGMGDVGEKHGYIPGQKILRYWVRAKPDGMWKEQKINL